MILDSVYVFDPEYSFGDYYYMDVTVDVAYDSGSLEPIFDYVDVLVSRERSKIFPDMNIK